MHSAVIAEPAAHIGGLLLGLGAYAAAGWFTPDLHTRVKIGMVTAAVSNLIIGGHINLLAKDFMSLVLLRPMSAYAAAELFQLVANNLGN